MDGSEPRDGVTATDDVEIRKRAEAAARAAYEDAAMQGLCEEGRQEAARGALARATSNGRSPK